MKIVVIFSSSFLVLQCSLFIGRKGAIIWDSDSGIWDSGGKAMERRWVGHPPSIIS
jgi:hypothetical protein